MQKHESSDATGKKADRGKRVNFTHFLSIPVVSPTLRQNIENLKEEILSKRIRGINPQSFCRIEDYHLTLLMLDLSDEENLENAKSLLKSHENLI